jgi:hypothetical protein
MAGCHDSAMNERFKEPVRKVIKLLAAGQYAELQTITNGVRLTAPKMAEAINEYGRKLIPVAEEGLDLMDVVEVRTIPPQKWSVTVPLWTREEGRSDLSLELTLIKDGDGFRIELDDIRVL